MMAHLIDLNERRAKRATPAPRLGDLADRPTARVLFFTGVRYERVEDVAPSLDLSDRLDGSPRGSRGKGKRRA